MSHEETLLEFLLRHRPKRYCDACLSDRCEIGTRKTVNEVMNRLVAPDGVSRSRAVCSACGLSRQTSAMR